jgi:Holliday junction DNA helicase RuvB
MMSAKPGLNPVQSGLDASYKCSKEAYDILRSLVRLGGFQSDNIISRLAIGRSLLEPAEKPLPDPLDSDGKEIKGVTLLGKPAVAALLLAMITHHAGIPLAGDDVRRHVRFHWERGLKLLRRDIDKDQAGLDAVLSNYATRSVLTDAEFEDQGEVAQEDILDIQIVGQEEAKKTVKRLLDEALKTTPAVLPETILFTGPASTGKTLFSTSIADALRLPYVEVTGTMLESAEKLFDQIDAELASHGQKYVSAGRRGGLPFRQYPALVIFIDECHQLKRPIQDALLTMTEPNERTAKVKGFIADMGQATVLLATTDSAKLTKPLKTRAREIRLQPYARDEVAEIIGRLYKGWPIDVRRLLAMAGRMTPRMAKERAKDLARILEQDHAGSRPSEALVIEVMQKEWGLDRLGLSAQDHVYLKLVSDSRGPAGLVNLASRLSLEPDQVEQEIEPFLLGLGLVERTSKGRILTEYGKNCVKDPGGSEAVASARV